MSSIRDQRKAADEQLGITASYEKAVSARTELEVAVAALGSLRIEKRKLEAAFADRESDVTLETWSDNPDVAITKMEKMVKVAIQQDEMLRALRDKLNEVASQIDIQEANKTVADAEIRVQCARMNELQGYLQFTVALMEKEKGE